MRALPQALIGRTDALLWLAVCALVPLGVLMVTSASIVDGSTPRATPETVRQGAYAAVGLVAMLVAAKIDYRLLERYSVWLVGMTTVLLIAVVGVGVAEHGAQRWLGFGGVTVQPSEFAKLTLAVSLAAYGAQREPRLATLVATVGVLGLPAGLVLLQPDLGSVVVLSGVWLVFVVAWGVPWRSLGALLLVMVSAGPIAFAVAVPAYQRERLAVFFDPGRDPLGSGFNLRQVEVALGTGGVTGHGLFSGAESHLDSVAARSSDFMFGFLGSELGLLGGLGLIALLALFVWRGLTAASHAPDAFGRLLAVALTSIVLVQGVVNIAVNLRLFPATGIPLPFIAQGGSSLVVMMAAVGLLQSIASRRPATPEEQWHGDRWR